MQPTTTTDTTTTTTITTTTTNNWTEFLDDICSTDYPIIVDNAKTHSLETSYSSGKKNHSSAYINKTFSIVSLFRRMVIVPPTSKTLLQDHRLFYVLPELISPKTKQVQQLKSFDISNNNNNNNNKKQQQQKLCRWASSHNNNNNNYNINSNGSSTSSCKQRHDTGLRKPIRTLDGDIGLQKPERSISTENSDNNFDNMSSEESEQGSQHKTPSNSRCQQIIRDIQVDL